MLREFKSLAFAATFGLALVLLLKLFAAPSASFEPTPEYAAACQGPPLRTMKKRIEAEEAGYYVNQAFDCIDKKSFDFVAGERAQAAAANTPEARAREREEMAAATARQAAEHARQVAVGAAEEEAARPRIVMRHVDVNSASEADIAGVIGVGPEVAAQVVSERARRRFADWNDLSRRVAGLGAAQASLYASIGGLTVDGGSLEGAPMYPTVAALIYEVRHGKRPVISVAPGEEPPAQLPQQVARTMLLLQTSLQATVAHR